MQNEQNPDVNSIPVDEEAGEAVEQDRGSEGDIERPKHDEPMPVPPDAEQRYPVEEPPGRDGPPVGDVDDSPKQIADKYGRNPGADDR